MNSNDNNSCKLGGDPLAYLYNEMPVSERGLFETHLADCEACTDEFAELSLARYSVYEWQKLEFAPMETPEIVIPFEPAKVGLFDKVRAAFAFSNNWATAGAAFAVLTAAVFGGIVMFNGFGESGGDISKVLEPSPSPVRVSTSPKPESIDEPKPNPPLNVDEPRGADPATKDENAVTTSVKKSPDKIRAVPVSTNQRPANLNNRNRNAPTLNNFENDDEDKSLRLTDIFDDLDTLE